MSKHGHGVISVRLSVNVSTVRPSSRPLLRDSKGLRKPHVTLESHRQISKLDGNRMSEMKYYVMGKIYD